MKVDDIHAEFGAMILLREAARQYAKRYPGKIEAGDMPIRALAEYSKEDQRALIQCVKAAVSAATGDMPELFYRFVQEKHAIAVANGQIPNPAGPAQ